MKLIYVVLNFLILAALVFVFGRKTIKGMFARRWERVQGELREIDEAAALEPPLAAAPLPQDAIAAPVDEIEKARAAYEEKLAQIRTHCAREKYAFHAKIVENLRKNLFSAMKKAIAGLFSADPYLAKIREREPLIVEDILKRIKLTPGDGAYLTHYKVLYVTLSSAFELDRELVDKVDAATRRLTGTIGGKTSFLVKTDPSLIGGLKLRIGDTVYDGTVSEALYCFEKSLSKDTISSEDSVDDIASEFFSKMASFSQSLSVYQLGRVISVSDGICWIDGLSNIMYGEIVEFEHGERGMVLDLQMDKVGCVVFGSYENLKSDTFARRLGAIASVRVGEGLLGRVVDALGHPIDGEGFIVTRERRPIEFNAPGIIERAPVDSPLFTGIKAIDALIPIGKGQRELIIGDRQTGKSSIAIDAVVNQKDKGTICIYVAIGQKETFVAKMREKLAESGALANTIIVSASASDSAALQYIAPFAATAMGEHFMRAGKDVLIVYDDLSKHAVAYRELSLLLHRPSGREAYPGDIFYLHSRLLERAAHLGPEQGGGSMTALPIVETLGGDISAYIPTNAISITDGQIFLETDLFNEGQRPAINASLSVSRVGGAAQTKLLKQLSASLRPRLAQYRELAEFMQFGSEVDNETKKTLKLGRMLTEALRQDRYSPVPTHFQSLLLFAVINGYANDLAPEEMRRFERSLFSYFESSEKEMTETLKTGEKLTAATERQLREALERFRQAGL